MFEGSLAKEPSKIKGGDTAQQGEFPWQVSLRINGQHFCAGSIIDKTHILTAAHCVDEEDGILAAELTVLVGTNNAHELLPTIHKVKSLHCHEKYKKQVPYRHDIAVVTV